MVAAKPSIKGQRFGMLTCIGKGGVVKDPQGRSRGLWDFRCDCGKIVSRSRGDVEHSGLKSCGCLGRNRKSLVDNKRRPKDIAGQRFGSLVAVRLTGKKDNANKPTWLLQCDCGGTTDLSLSRLGNYDRAGYQIHCGNKAVHQVGLWYPPTPSPYPKDAGKLLEKYLYLTRTRLKKNNAAIEDEKRDRLIRICWILTYRKSQGEVFSEALERNYVTKSLAYVSVDVFWKEKLPSEGGMLYSRFGVKKQIGSEMTDSTFQNYPVAEAQTQGKIFLSAPKKPKRFRRC